LQIFFFEEIVYFSKWNLKKKKDYFTLKCWTCHATNWTIVHHCRSGSFICQCSNSPLYIPFIIVLYGPFVLNPPSTPKHLQKVLDGQVFQVCKPRQKIKIPKNLQWDSITLWNWVQIGEGFTKRLQCERKKSLSNGSK